MKQLVQSRTKPALDIAIRQLLEMRRSESLLSISVDIAPLVLMSRGDIEAGAVEAVIKVPFSIIRDVLGYIISVLRKAGKASSDMVRLDDRSRMAKHQVVRSCDLRPRYSLRSQRYCALCLAVRNFINPIN